MRRTLLTLSAILVISNACWGAGISSQNFKISRAPVSELLSQQTIRQTFQDSTGFLWILTQEGLHRYDGYNIRSFLAGGDASGSISHNNVRQIAQDQLGQLWIATIGGGLNYYDSQQQRFESLTSTGSFDNSPLSNNISSLFTDSSGFMWIGYSEGLVSLFDPYSKTFRPLPQLNKTAELNGAISGFAEDDRGMLWIATSRGGVIAYDKSGRAANRYTHDPNDPNSISSDRISTIITVNGDQIWIGSEDKGLVIIDSQGGIVARFRHDSNDSDSLSNDAINTQYLDKHGRIWIGTDLGLNLYLKNENFASFSRKNSNLQDDFVHSVLQDQRGNYWIGTHYGLYTGFHSSFDLFDTKRGLPEESITAFAQSEEDSIWVGSFSGLFHFALPTSVFTDARNRLLGFDQRDDRVMALAAEGDALWVGYRSAGLDRIDLTTGNIVSFTEQSEGLSDNAVTSISIDERGYTWVSTYGGGLNQIDSSSLETSRIPIRTAPQLPGSSFIYNVMPTDNQALFIATTLGLYSYNIPKELVQKVQFLPHTGGLSGEDQILAIREDTNSNIWLGLQYQGLALWSADQRQQGRNHIEKVITTPPLPSSTIYAIEQDNQGMLWLSSPAGLVRMDPATRKIRSFDYSDGLQDNEFNFGASFKDSKGRLYFGGNRGFNRFDPAEVRAVADPPALALTTVDIAGRQLRQDVSYNTPKQIELTHEDYFINFEFSALDFTDPANNQYQYKLENFDPGWIQIGTRHNVTFTSLPSGHYLLRIKASNADGAWNHEGLSIPLIVYPAPWGSWWAFSLYLGGILGVFWSVSKYHDTWLKKERATETAAEHHATAERAMDELQDQLQVEQSLVQNLHTHAESTLGVISGLLQRQADAINDESILDLFRDNQQRFTCLQFVEEHIYYAADTLEVSLHAYAESLFHSLSDLMVHRGLEITPINECIDSRIPANVAVPAAMIINELVVNSLKHGFEQATGIHYVRVRFSENRKLDTWTLEVRDSGCGLPPNIDPLNPGSLGLEIVKLFADQIQASIEVSTDSGCGLRFEIPRQKPDHRAAF